ncbi:MAG TPA: universal stress protein [Anaerolineales bacterium]|nr:universal stress protein [Anaerolineales bacterium]
MPGIICAIRGGARSLPTIDKAIELAKQSDKAIYFLYVVNLDFLLQTGRSRVHTISHELREMGEFILLSAQITADKQGITASGVVREGEVGEEIIRLGKEIGADFVVLGRPHAQTAQNVFDLERMRRFSERIEEETGAKVVLPEEDES